MIFDFNDVRAFKRKRDFYELNLIEKAYVHLHYSSCKTKEVLKMSAISAYLSYNRSIVSNYKYRIQSTSITESTGRNRFDSFS